MDYKDIMRWVKDNTIEVSKRYRRGDILDSILKEPGKALLFLDGFGYLRVYDPDVFNFFGLADDLPEDYYKKELEPRLPLLYKSKESNTLVLCKDGYTGDEIADKVNEIAIRKGWSKENVIKGREDFYRVVLKIENNYSLKDHLFFLDHNRVYAYDTFNDYIRALVEVKTITDAGQESEGIFMLARAISNELTRPSTMRGILRGVFTDAFIDNICPPNTTITIKDYIVYEDEEYELR